MKIINILFVVVIVLVASVNCNRGIHKLLGPGKYPFLLQLAAQNKLQLPSSCEEKWTDSLLDHFSFMQEDSETLTFKQRYFVCDEYWKPDEQGRPGPIFFYTGNEAPVNLFVNNTGLMWEWAPEFGALLIFAEHRYYGESVPLTPLTDPKNLRYLTTEQAMMDYATLIYKIRDNLNARNAPVIGFGGSYGGMLASWMRMKYPAVLDGAVAGSAPIWAYYGEVPHLDEEGFARIETYDATPAAGSSAACVDNVRNVWKTMDKMSKTKEGLEAMSEAFSLCPNSSLTSAEQVDDLRDWASGAIGNMAMGNYPFRSSYMTLGDGSMPAYPMRVLCRHLSDPELKGVKLLSQYSKGISVYNNASKDVECYNIFSDSQDEWALTDYLWNFQFCTEQFMPMSQDGVHDFFWPEKFDKQAQIQWCSEEYGIKTGVYHAQIQWGGRDIRAASNIVFSNGEYDPWRYGGVTTNQSESLVAIVIPKCGHHADLMFSTPHDPLGLTNARLKEKELVSMWIQEAYNKALSVDNRASCFSSRCVDVQ